MRRLVTFTTTTLVGLMVLSSSAFAAPENDAGKGGDASDVQSAPTLVGTSWAMGTLHAPSDTDWFAPASPSASPSCLKFTSAVTRDTKLAIVNGANTVTSFGSASLQTLSLAGAGSGSAVSLAGGAPDQPGHYAFNLRSFSASDLGPADAGTGSDASTSAPVTIQPGCVGGKLTPTSLDTTDVYAISGNAGDRMVLSLAAASSAPLALRLLDPNGVPIGAPISPDGLIDLTLPASGTYSLSISAPAPTLGDLLYIIGVILGPPGCEPGC